MKKLTYLLLFAMIYMVSAPPAQADIKKLAQTGLQFLKVDVGARAAAMGGAYAMVGQDATAMFYNPAGLAHMQHNFEFFASQTQWISNISYSAGGIAANLGNVGVVGLSLVNANYGDIQGTRVASNTAGFEKTGLLNVGAYAIGLSYGRRISDKFSVGGQVKLAAQHLGSSLIDTQGTEHTNKVSGMAYDFGTMFYPGFGSFRLGMFIRNFSPQFKYEKEAFQLPLTFQIGMAMDVLDVMGDHPNSSLLLSVDALHPRDYTERIHVGAEYMLMNMIFVRGGYKFNYDEEGLTAGVGLQSNYGGYDVNIGYAYSAFGVFNAVNRFELNLGF